MPRSTRLAAPALHVALAIAIAAPIGASARPAAAEVLLYVSVQNDDAVQVIDVAAGAVVDTIPVGDGPQSIAFVPDGSRFYVANAGDGTLSVVDAATHLVVDTIAVGDNPVGAVMHPGGATLYVTNAGDDTVSVVDTASHVVVTNIPVGSSPVGVEIAPDGSRLYVANRDGASVSIIDTATNAVIDTVAVGGSPNFMAVHPSGVMVYVPNGADDDLSVLYPATGAVVTNVAVGDLPVLVGIDPNDDGVAWVANLGGGIMVIDLASNAITATIPFSDPGDFAFHPAGDRVYVPSFDMDEVAVIDVATKTVVGTITVGDGPLDVTVAPVTPCPADVDGDGTTGFADLLAILSSWGPCP